MRSQRPSFVALLLGLIAAVPALPAAELTPVPSALRPFFSPPAEFAGQFGTYASPLKFADGRPVATPAEWPARRAEILKYWHEQLGPWPELLARPRLELGEKYERDGVTHYRVQVEIAPGVMQHAFLLLPPARFTGPRPAVLVPFYVPEVSVAYAGPTPLTGSAKRMMETGVRGALRDFAWQLTRRGFVTLSIGTPGDDARLPDLKGARCQPLSYYAYISANLHTVLAQRPEVDPNRIGVMGHSYGGKWAMFASCFYDKFAAAVWSDGGVVFDEKRGGINYWEPWYLGLETGRTRAPGLITADSPRTGPYKRIVESGHDLHELHALMAPRPFLVSGGAEDHVARWVALNHAVAVNKFLGYENRVAMTNRKDHSPTPESNEQAYQFLEHFLGPLQ